MIWSSLALNRSFCPVSRRSLGRIESPLFCSPKAKRITANAGDQFCKKIRAQAFKTGQYEYWRRPKPILLQTHLKSSRATDSHHVGVAYGKFDHYRLIDTL